MKITNDGETFVLTFTGTGGTTQTATGTAVKLGDTWTVTPKVGGSFTVKIESTGMTDITGTITDDNGNPIPAPSGTLTPSTGGGGGGVAKTIEITGYPGSMEAGTQHNVLIYNAGAVMTANPLAVATNGNGSSVSGSTLTAELKTSSNSPWTGSGNFDVYVIPKQQLAGAKYYKASNVSITTAITTILSSSFVYDSTHGGGGGNTLVITAYNNTHFQAGTNYNTMLVPVGTGPSQVMSKIVATSSAAEGASLLGTSLTLPLKKDGSPWAGSGNYDIWFVPYVASQGNHSYFAGNESIATGTTTIAANKFVDQGAMP